MAKAAAKKTKEPMQAWRARAMARATYDPYSNSGRARVLRAAGFDPRVHNAAARRGVGMAPR